MKISKNRKYFFVNKADVPGIDNFWVLLERGLWEFDTFQIFDEFLDKEHSYIDIGAWVGPTVLYGCQLAKHCYAAEPDSVALKVLQENIDLNPRLANNITLYRGCIGDSSGIVRLGSNTHFGDSSSSLLFNKSNKFLDVQSLTFDDFIKINNIDDCNFIKMDIEGGEAKVLPTMRKYLQEKIPTLFLSLHPFLFENNEKYCNAIIDILSIYPHIYSSDCKKIELDERFAVFMSTTKGNFSVIATAEWNYNRRLVYLYKYGILKFVNRSKYYLSHPSEIPVLIKHKFKKSYGRFQEIIRKG